MSEVKSKIPPEEWLSDVEAAFALQTKLEESKDKYPEQFSRMFAERYHDDAIRSYRQARVASALNWLQMHRDEIEAAIPDETVTGQQGVLVSRRMILALWRLFSNCPDDMVNHDFPVWVFLESFPDSA